MSQRHYCDICGKEIINPIHELRLTFGLSSNVYEICSSCYNNLRYYIEEERRRNLGGK